MNMDTSWFMEWYWKEATEQEKRLFEKVGQFEDEYFQDMLFGYGTCTYNLIKVKSQIIGEKEWRDDSITIPEDLEYFDPTMIHYQVKDLEEGYMGFYHPKEQLICVSRDYYNNDAVILHEMIHMHEDIINKHLLYYHDLMYWALYTDLKKKVPDIDDIITGQAHMLNEEQLYEAGGLHDILFLIKSLQLDYLRGYSFGTVFGYGLKDEL